MAQKKPPARLFSILIIQVKEMKTLILDMYACSSGTL
jgi:hypothetical protein